MMSDAVVRSCTARHSRGPPMKRSRSQSLGAHKKLRSTHNAWVGADQRLLITSSVLESNVSASPSDKQTLDFDCHHVDVDVDPVNSFSHEKFFIPPNNLWVPD